MNCNKQCIFIFKINFGRKTCILEMHVVSLHNVLDNVKNAISRIVLDELTQVDEGAGDLKKLVIKLLHVQEQSIKVTISRFKKENKLL